MTWVTPCGPACADALALTPELWYRYVMTPETEKSLDLYLSAGTQGH